MIPLARVDKVKDLGVWFDEQYTFKEHMHDKINKAYSMLGIIKRNFKYLTIPTFILLYCRNRDRVRFPGCENQCRNVDRPCL